MMMKLLRCLTALLQGAQKSDRTGDRMTLLLTVGKAFLCGGAICLVGQILIDRTALTPGKVLVLFVVCGVALGAVGLYGPFARFAGEGAAVPITGFGYALVKGTKEAIDARGWRGILEGPFSAASVGTLTAVLCGLAVSVVARSKDK